MEYSCQSLSLIINFCHSEQGNISLPHPRWLEFAFQEAVQPFGICRVYRAWSGGVSHDCSEGQFAFPTRQFRGRKLLPDHGCSTFSHLRCSVLGSIWQSADAVQSLSHRVGQGRAPWKRIPADGGMCLPVTKSLTILLKLTNAASSPIRKKKHPGQKVVQLVLNSP